MSRRTPFLPVRGFARGWTALRARSSFPWLLATFTPQSTCHGPRSGFTLALWCSGGLTACPGAKSTRNDPWPEEKKMPMCKKNTFIQGKIYDAVGVTFCFFMWSSTAVHAHKLARAGEGGGYACDVQTTEGNQIVRWTRCPRPIARDFSVNINYTWWEYQFIYSTFHDARLC